MHERGGQDDGSQGFVGPGPACKTVGCEGESSRGKSQHHALSTTADRGTGERTKLRVPTPGRGGRRDRESCLGQSRDCGKQRQASSAEGMRRWPFWVPAKACRRRSVASEGNVELNMAVGGGGEATAKRCT